MDDYSKSTIKLLLERHPEYLKDILVKLVKYSGDNLSGETPESIFSMIANQKHDSQRYHESSIYTCRCGSKSVITREIQNRSLDEASSIVHICTSCGKQF